MRVRPATLEDAERIADVEVRSRQAAYLGLVPQSRLDALDLSERLRVWTATLEQTAWPRRGMLVAEEDAQVVALVDLCPALDPDQDPERAAEIASLYVSPTSWGRGIGRGLMATALDTFRRAGYLYALLWVLETNVRATGFYAHLGWRLDGAVEDAVVSDAPIRYVRYRRELD